MEISNSVKTISFAALLCLAVSSSKSFAHETEQSSLRQESQGSNTEIIDIESAIELDECSFTK